MMTPSVTRNPVLMRKVDRASTRLKCSGSEESRPEVPLALACHGYSGHPVTVPQQRGTEPDGYQQPKLVYLVEFTDESGYIADGQAGAFTTEADAVVVRDRLLAGSTWPYRVNTVPMHMRAEEWEFDP